MGRLCSLGEGGGTTTTPEPPRSLHAGRAGLLNLYLKGKSVSRHPAHAIAKKVAVGAAMSASAAQRPAGAAVSHELDAATRKIVGRAAKERARHNTIIPLYANAAFLPFLRNLLCSMRRLDVHNWLVMSLDNATCAELGRDDPGPPHRTATFCVQVAQHTPGLAKYRSASFNAMVILRPMWTRHLLQLGLTVLQCDLDVVWIRDPQSLLRSLVVARSSPNASVRVHPIATIPTPRAIDASRNIRSRSSPAGAGMHIPDALFQSEQAHGLNAGFYLMRPTAAAIALLRAWIEQIAASTVGGLEEQHELNRALGRLKLRGTSLLYGALHDEQFPNGKIWWTYTWLASKQVAFVVHANWAKNAKRARLARDGLWLLSPDGRTCVDPTIDPAMDGCSKLCVPVGERPGATGLVPKTCEGLNREDDRQARRYGANWSLLHLRGQLWHPRAYRFLNCTRNTSRVSHAAQLHVDMWTAESRISSRTRRRFL